MAKTFQLIVRTPDAEIENREVQSIKVTTEAGEMMVYPGHSSLSGSILFSNLQVKGEGFEENYVVRRGLIFVSLEANRTTIMAYSVVKTDDVKYETVSEYMEHLEEQLKKDPESLNEFQISFLESEKLVVKKHLKAMKK